MIIRAVLICLYSAFGASGASSPFLAADHSLLPGCQIYGRTYCLDIDSYPTDTIRYLLDNHLVDVTSIILSEGVPLMKNTQISPNRTHSLHFGDDGSLHSHFVRNRSPKKQPESISVKLHHKIPAVSSKTSNVVTGMRKPEPQRNVLNANLQPITNQQNSATLSQPKDLKTSESILGKLQNEPKKQPFIVHGTIVQDGKALVSSAEYEPPKGSQEFHFDQFQEVTTSEEGQESTTEYRPKIIQPGFSSFFDQSELAAQHKRFQNPNGLTFKTVTTELPRFTYSVLTTPSSEQIYETTTTEIPRYTYKVEEPIKAYTYKIIEDELTSTTTPTPEISPEKYSFNFELTSTEATTESEQRYYTYKIIENKTVDLNSTPATPTRYDFKIVEQQPTVDVNLEESRPPKFDYKLLERSSTPSPIPVDLNQEITPTRYDFKIVNSTPKSVEEIEENITDKLKKFAYKLLGPSETESLDLNSVKNVDQNSLSISELPTRPHGHPVNFGYPQVDHQVDLNHPLLVDDSQYPIEYDIGQYVVNPTKYSPVDLNQYPQDPYESYPDYDQPPQFDYVDESYQPSSTEQRPFKNFVDHVKFTFDYDRLRPTTQSLIQTTEKPRKYDFKIVSTTEKPSTQLTSTTHSPTFTYGLLKNEPTTKSSIRNYVDDIQTTPQITSTERPKLKYEYDLLQESPTKSVDFNSNSQYSFGTIEDTPKYSFSAVDDNQPKPRPEPIAYNSKPVDDNQDSPKLKYTYGILEDAKLPKSVDFNQETNEESTQKIIEKLKYNFRFLDEKEEKATSKSSFKFVDDNTTTAKPRDFKFPVASTAATIFSTLYRWDKDEEHEHEHSTETYGEEESTKSLQDLEASPTNVPNVDTTLGYLLGDKDKPELTTEERKKLGLVYYKPLSDELAKLLSKSQSNTLNIRDAIPTKDAGLNKFDKIKEEIQNDLKELDVIAEQYLTSAKPDIITASYPTAPPVYSTAKPRRPEKVRVFSEPNVSIDMPSPPLDLSKPFGEFDFKPIINPPPDFYKFKPVKANPFNNEDLLLSAPRAQPKDSVLDQNIDTYSAPFVPPDVIHSVEYEDAYYQPEYQPQSSHSQETYQYVEEPQAQYEHVEYQEEPQDQYQQPLEELDAEQKKSRSGFLLKSAFRRVTSMLDSLFYKGFGLSRSKRSIGGTRSNVCPTRTHFIHPRVAFSVKGQWLYVVNLPGREDQQQGIVTEECTTTECSGVCSKESESVQSAKCEPQFVQKRLLALHPSGHKLISELFWFPVTCRCVVVS